MVSHILKINPRVFFSTNSYTPRESSSWKHERKKYTWKISRWRKLSVSGQGYDNVMRCFRNWGWFISLQVPPAEGVNVLELFLYHSIRCLVFTCDQQHNKIFMEVFFYRFHLPFASSSFFFFLYIHQWKSYYVKFHFKSIWISHLFPLQHSPQVLKKNVS